MNTFSETFMLLVIYAVVFTIKNATILDKPRFWLCSKHPLLFSLFNCPFCLGFHCGWIVYLAAMHKFSFMSMLLWALAGATFSYCVDNIFTYAKAESAE